VFLHLIGVSESRDSLEVLFPAGSHNITRMANGLLSLTVWGGFGFNSNVGSVILLSMRHLCFSCNGWVFAVIQSRISLTLPALGAQAKI